MPVFSINKITHGHYVIIQADNPGQTKEMRIKWILIRTL